MNGKFIRANDGQWHNSDYIRSFYIGGDEEVGFRICISYEFIATHARQNNFSVGHMSIGSTFKTKDECQQNLDVFLGMTSNSEAENE